MKIDTGQQEKPPFKVHKHLSDKKWLIVLAVVILFLAGAISGWIFVISQKKSDSSSAPAAQSKSLIQGAEKEKIINELDAVVAKSGPEAGQAFLDSRISKTTDKQEQSLLYSVKSTYSAFNVNENSQSDALKAAYKAEELGPTEDTAYVVAYLEENYGSINNAIKYYKIFLERIPKPSQMYDNDFEYYSDHVKSLEAETS